MKYPEYITYLTQVNGYTTAKDNTIFEENELGTVIKVTMPDDDTVFDQVHVHTSSNNSYEIDFVSKQTKLKTSHVFKAPVFDVNQVTQTEIIAIPDHNEETHYEYLYHKSFIKRFYIVSLPYLAILYGSVRFIDDNEYTSYFVFLLFVPFVWIVMEHDYLFKVSNYLRMLVFSFLILGLGYYSISENLIDDNFTFIGILTTPLLLLIYQKILSLS